MPHVHFRHIAVGEKFVDVYNQAYTKTTHMRGYYYEEGRTIHKRFKKKSLVYAIVNKWEQLPEGSIKDENTNV